MLSLSVPEQGPRVFGQQFEAAQRAFELGSGHALQHPAQQFGVEDAVLGLHLHSGSGKGEADATAILVVARLDDVAAAHETGHDDAHGGTADAHVLGELRQRRWPRWVEMIEHAGLALGNALAGLVGAKVAAMAGEEDVRIGIEHPLNCRVQHRQQGAGIG